VPGPGTGLRFSAAAFNPLSIAGCQLWLRSDLGVTLSGSFVSQWVDQSPNGSIFTPSNALSPPQYTGSSGVNGLPNIPKLSFNGSTQNLTSSVNLTTTNCTYFFAIRYSTLTPGNFSFFLSTRDNPSGGSGGLEIGFNPITGGKRNVNIASVSSFPIFDDISTNTEIWQVTETPGGTWNLLVNGQQHQAPYNNFPPNNGNGGTVIGSRNGGSLFFAGDMFEAISYTNVLSDAQAALVTRYLMTRYNVGGGSRGVGFQPTQMNGLVGWWRADQGVSLDNAGNVQSWSDISGNGNNASQGTLANRPVLVPSDPGYNGQPTVQFTKASTQSLALQKIMPSQPMTCVVVGESTSGATQQQFFGDSVNNVTGPYWTGATWAMFAGSNVSALGPYANANGRSLCMAAVFNVASSALYINNSSGSVGAGSAGATSPSGVESLGGTGTGTITLNGKIAEIMFFNRPLSQVELSWLFQYLASRYNPGNWS